MKKSGFTPRLEVFIILVVVGIVIYLLSVAINNHNVENEKLHKELCKTAICE